jgi:hypothetical protein
MKRIILAGVALFALAAVSPALADNNSNTVNGASATGTAAVTIYTPVTVTQTQGLDFGTIASGANGTVAIDAGSGARNVAGGVGAVAANVGKQGTFAVSGQSNAAINVVVGGAITGFSGGITGATKTSPLPTALNNGSAAFSVGGTLTVPANTQAGAYAGTYTVAVNYP